ncbi:MAG: hypothetical protein OSB58_12220 [Alphaproteobacteria bacterium]|nr:hypothetical protein [Alphaproteobacteria bacterium]
MAERTELKLQANSTLLGREVRDKAGGGEPGGGEPGGGEPGGEPGGGEPGGEPGGEIMALSSEFAECRPG